MSISRKRLEEIQNIPDAAIDTSDIPELDEHFWETAKMVLPTTKNSTVVLSSYKVFEKEEPHIALFLQ
ncbi:MAG: hypothetical protein HC916_09030 [Coleofasciculaceae cyanobacterium SM2_1_6]|nr:hypothetical protein [Coleofasciculaceae cyanobacterium SM2_1_6]